MTYNISYNAQYNSREIYFDGKPSEAVRDALKALKFRWHSVKRCWYGYGSEESIAAAITGTTTEEAPASVVGDGYLGGGAIYGSKSNHYLHGSDLSAAIRADIKKAGIKGATAQSPTLHRREVIDYDSIRSNRITCTVSHRHFRRYQHNEEMTAPLMESGQSSHSICG